MDTERFIIDNDQKAEWALKTIAKVKAESDYIRLIKICKDQIESYKRKISEYERLYDEETVNLKSKLYEYFHTVKHRITPTQEIYDLPSGKLRLKTKVAMDYDPSTLVEHLEKTAPDLIKKTPQWGEYKSRLKVTSLGVVDTITGEIVPCIKTEVKEPEFVVEVESI